MLTFAEVSKLARQGNVLPLSKRIPADLDTPVSAYMKLTRGEKQSFLLESIEGGEKLARYSFIGFRPHEVIEADASRVSLTVAGKTSIHPEAPLEFIRRYFGQYHPVRVENLPRFTGGGVGYFSYDTIRHIEEIPDVNPDNIGLPEIRIGIFDTIVAFDHIKQEIVIISNILLPPTGQNLRRRYNAACEAIEEIVERLGKSTPRTRPVALSPTRPIAQYTRKEYMAMVRRAKEYIKEGDIFQVVLSQRWHAESNRSALDVYRRLRRMNPSPYMFLLEFDTDAIVGSSPEMMVRVEDGIIETRPIAGTRPRGKNEQEDEELIADLMSDPKELAEHTMLLDLGRNDIGRVSKAGSVSIGDKMIAEKYSHVIHIVSSVSGQVKKGISSLDGHFACFPAGTVSGAPKIRAMEIIDELEKERRGVYAGSIAYLDFWGNLDSCIAIRTIVKRGKTYYIQAGAGIVADSQPSREFSETEAKAEALMRAVSGEGI